jgi:hypothetical protein
LRLVLAMNGLPLSIYILVIHASRKRERQKWAVQ